MEKIVHVGRRDQEIVLQSGAAEGTERFVSVRKRDDGDDEYTPGAVEVQGCSKPILLSVGDTMRFFFYRGRWTCPTLAYEFLQSLVMHQLYAIRYSKQQARISYTDVDALLDKAWRARRTERDYFALKKTAHAAGWLTGLDDFQVREMQLLGFHYRID